MKRCETKLKTVSKALTVVDRLRELETRVERLIRSACSGCPSSYQPLEGPMECVEADIEGLAKAMNIDSGRFAAWVVDGLKRDDAVETSCSKCKLHECPCMAKRLERYPCGSFEPEEAGS